LRFPHALLLLPLGIVAILMLNVLRIAALVSLGAHISPEMAAGGFHSQAGWMAFLAVTIGIMVVAPRIALFSRAPVIRQPEPTPYRAQPGIDGDRIIAGLLLPFMALMAGSILTAASAPFDIPLYGVKVAAAGVVLWLLRDVWQPIVALPAAVPVVAGLIVGLGWIVTDPFPASGLGGWLAAQPHWIVAAWLTVRAIGGLVVVPLVE
ncbi:unnamed protein product, partial [Phaeothamnion confervicola]